ncbi:MAG: ATP-binding protein [Flavobacteriales bacterium]
MRFLNKITFINSASIKYAEINVSGNVHFIGTQGVGKSTLLRAILFFYNADKTKLGISREKQNFDSYYFPYQNSYIIFEVVKEDITYSVLAFKSGNRVAFRFLDAPYKKQYFIDDMGHAMESWDKIKLTLKGHVQYSNKITSYDEYKNIIYGNDKSLGVEFKKYALLESKQYQNIPRTIQNVFLNTKLDADFIKETIINSLNQDTLKIDLKTYSENHLNGFEEELNEIRLWSKKNKTGEIPVRIQAEKIANTYKQLNVYEQKKRELTSVLYQSVKKNEAEKPKVDQQLKRLDVELELVKGQFKTLDTDKNNELQDINTQIGILKKEIRLTKSKQKQYSGIEEKISRVESKSLVEKEKVQFEKELQILTSQFLEIGQKFKAQVDLILNENRVWETEILQTKTKLESEFIFFKEDLNAKYDSIFEEMNRNAEEHETRFSETLQSKQNELLELSKTEIELKHKVYFKQEIAHIIDQNTNFETEIKAWTNGIEEAKKESDHLRTEWEFTLKRVEAEKEMLLKSSEFEIGSVCSKIEKLKQIIDQNKGSLFEWLNANHPTWTETVGKVIDHDDILFHKGLKPELVKQNSESFYGVKLDLSKIEKPIKTLEQYHQELKVLESEFELLSKKQSQDVEVLNADLKLLKNKYQSKIESNKDFIQTSRYKIDQLTLSKKENLLLKEDFLSKAETEKQQQVTKIEHELSILKSTILDLEEKQNEQRKSLKTKIEEKKGLKLEEVKLKKEALEQEIQTKTELLLQKITENKEKVEALQQEEKSELTDYGADTEKIAILEKSIVKCNLELDFIEKHRDEIAEYKKDKKEYFDKLDWFVDQKKQLESKSLGLKDLYQIKIDETNTKREAIERDIDGVRQIQKSIFKQLDHFSQFKKSEVFASVQVFYSSLIKEKTFVETTTQIIDALNEAYYSVIKAMNHLQGDIHKFTSHFSENNIFKFKTVFKSKAEYLQFAEMLKEFIVEDKITDLEKRVHDRFTHIFGFIGKQTADILSKEDEIQAVLNKINKDFVSKNFVGAIKSMELRKVESSNKIMKLLVDIKNFNDEFGDELGHHNLFSSPDREQVNKKAVTLISQFISAMNDYKFDHISVSDSFGLQFKIQENANNTGWVEKLTNIGSEGTDILIKAMINIMLLNVFKETASSQFKDFKLHCMMDEIGKLHPSNIKGILQFANDRNILLINSSPTSYNATNYKYTYILSKDNNHITRVKMLVKKNPTLLDQLA